MHASFLSELEVSRAHQLVRSNGGIRCILEAAFRYQNLALPKGLILNWDGQNFPSEFAAKVVAGVCVDGIPVEIGSELRISCQGYYWSACLAAPMQVAGLQIPRHSRVEWLFGLEQPEYKTRPVPFQIDFPRDVLYRDSFDTVQLDSKGTSIALRAATDTTAEGLKIIKGQWLFLNPRPWVSDRPSDPAMRHYDGSGGKDV